MCLQGSESKYGHVQETPIVPLVHWRPTEYLRVPWTVACTPRSFALVICTAPRKW